MILQKRSLMVLAAGVSCIFATGCSTWRCRGFVNEHLMPQGTSKNAYVLESIEFQNVVRAENEDDLSPQLTWLSQQDGLIDTSYLSDIDKELGLTNNLPDAVRVCIYIVPIKEERTGRDTLAWPMCGTFGVFPSHLVTQIPFDVIVRFIGKDPYGKDYSYATASMGLVRVDYQCGLSRLDMDAPPAAESAVGEVRDDGTIGTGRGLRQERLREIFVKTVAAAVKKAIATREQVVCSEVPYASTEFGPVPFPDPDVAMRESTPGWGANPVGVRATAETIEEFSWRAWNAPDTDQLKNLKRMVNMKMLSKEDWTKQVEDVWKRMKGQK